MNRLALLLTFMSTSALASDNYTQDARALSAAALCGATNTTCQQAYISGAKTSAASKRVETTYRAIRAAEVPTPPPPPPAPPPSPPPPPGVIPTPGLDPVADGLDVASLLTPSWGAGAIPPSSAPDFLGAFRFICQPGQVLFDDPIVYPGQPGKSHLHQFFGNLGANANSTYASLRSSGNSSCMNTLNRSAYWMPAMLNGKGMVVSQDYVSIYYKRRPKTDPECTRAGKACVNLPRGLRYIFGYDMLNMGAPKTGGGYFNCQGTGSTPGHYASITEAAKFCPVGAQLGAVISAPECWNGVDLDSANHRSHMAYMVRDVNTGQPACPATHPYIVPQFTLGAWWTVDADLDRSGVWDGTFNGWHLSSDDMPGMPMKPGMTFHTDWFGAWNDAVLDMWHGGCIDGLLNCSGGDTGTGKQLKQGYPDKWTASPHLVPVPPHM